MKLSARLSQGNPGAQFHRAREDCLSKAFYWGFSQCANPQPKKRPAPHRGTGKRKLTRLCLGLLFLYIHLGVDARSHQLQLFEPLLGLLAPRSARIEFDRFLVGLDGSRRKLDDLFIADFFRGHFIDQLTSQEVPGLRILWIEVRGFLQRFDGFAEPVRVVQAYPKVAPPGFPILPPHFSPLCACALCLFFPLPSCPQPSSTI